MPDNRMIRQIARANGGKLLNAAIDTLLPVDAAAVGKKSLLGGIVGAVAVKVATRSVPGAILVGGAVIAKRLYDRRRVTPAAAKAAQKADPKA